MDAVGTAPEGFLSGLLGCPERVSKVGSMPDQEFFAVFERMLQSIRFRYA